MSQRGPEPTFRRLVDELHGFHAAGRRAIIETNTQGRVGYIDGGPQNYVKPRPEAPKR